MKIIDRKYVFLNVIMVFAFLILLVKVITNDINQTMVVEKSNESFIPLTIDNQYKVIDYKMDSNEITIYLKNIIKDEIYESTLPKDDIEELVCDNLFKEFYGEDNKYWDCSTELLKNKSLVTEVAKQTIEIINEK